MKILITGATGFIGKNLVRKLRKIYPNSSITCVIRKKSITNAIDNLNLKFVLADISNYNQLKQISNTYDIIFHCAGYVGNSNKKKLIKHNIQATENIYRYAKETNSKKVIYVSSVATICGNNNIPLTENLPYNSLNLYGWSKIQAEKIALKYRNDGVPTAIIRPTMIYGHEEPHLLKIIIKLIKHRLLFIIPDNTTKFHIVYIQNVIDCLIDAISNENYLSGTYFIADEEVFTYGQIMDIIAETINAPYPRRIPKTIIALLSKIPFLRKRINNRVRTRQYSLVRLKSTGFKHKHHTIEALVKTCKLIEKTSKYNK